MCWKNKRKNHLVKIDLLWADWHGHLKQPKSETGEASPASGQPTARSTQPMAPQGALRSHLAGALHGADRAQGPGRQGQLTSQEVRGQRDPWSTQQGADHHTSVRQTQSQGETHPDRTQHLHRTGIRARLGASKSTGTGWRTQEGRNSFRLATVSDPQIIKAIHKTIRLK